MNEKKHIIYIAISIVIGFVICTTGFIIGYNNGLKQPRDLNQRYDAEHRSATETIDRIESELNRERELNTRARELVNDVAAASGRNVRNLQDAIIIIGEIRAKLQILADFYAGSDSSVSDTGGSGGL